MLGYTVKRKNAFKNPIMKKNRQTENGIKSKNSQERKRKQKRITRRKKTEKNLLETGEKIAVLKLSEC